MQPILVVVCVPFIMPRADFARGFFYLYETQPENHSTISVLLNGLKKWIY